MRRAARRRRRLARTAVVVATLGALAVVASVLAAGGGGPKAASGRGRTPAGSGTTTPATSRTSPPVGAGTHPTSSTSPPVGAPGAHPTASASLQLAGASGTPGGATLELPTTVWFPATASSGADPGSPDVAGGPYPLVVFSQGYDLAVAAYGPLLQELASAGFVVAAPTFPHTDPSEHDGLDEADIVNHPADLRFAIGALLNLAGHPGSVLSGLVDPAEVGLLGHSDGGDVSLAVAADSCCRDSSVKALALLSGAELSSFGGTYFSGPAVPLLVVQGTADTINPPACSVQIYDSAPPPRYYLDLLGASHEPPYLDPGTTRDIVVRAVADFFAGTLARNGGGLAALARDGTVPGTAALIAGSPMPPAGGGCPGAPA